MATEKAAAVRIQDLDAFSKYVEKVFRASEAYMDGVKEQDLAEVQDLPVLGRPNLYQVIGGIVLHHGAEHLGEIWYVKGLQGLKGSPI